MTFLVTFLSCVTPYRVPSRLSQQEGTIILEFLVGIVILSVVMGLVRILVRILFGRS